MLIIQQLIYVLGYDLLKEAVWDTWGRVSAFEYINIWIIILSMTYFDFVVGIGVGSKSSRPTSSTIAEVANSRGRLYLLRCGVVPETADPSSHERCLG